MKTAVRVLLLAIACQPAAGQSLSLHDAVDETLARNPAIAAAEAQKHSAEAREAEVRAGRYPRVEITESATRGNNPVFVFGSLLEQGEFAARHFDPAFLNAPDALTNFRAALTARVAIFDRFHTTNAVRRSRNGVSRAEIELEEVRQRMRAETIARFYGVAVAEERLRLANEVARVAEADAKATRDRFDQGLLVESEPHAADVHVANLKTRVLAADGDLAIARDAVTMESIAAWHHLRVARETASVAAAAVEQAQSAARIVRDRYEQGLTTITEHLRAQTALVSARFDLLAARYETVVAHAELLRATGDLHDVESFR